jgi:outer membrane protein
LTAKIKKMKKILSIVIVVIAVSFAANAQGPKLGHVNYQKVITGLPGYKAAETKLQEFSKQLQDTYVAMQNEYQTKVQDYTEKEKNMLPAIKEVKQKEIIDLEKRMQSLEMNSQQQLMEKQQELLAPLEEKVVTAVKAIAKEKGYSYVFDTAPGSGVLYAPDSDDITTLLKEKLGIK